MERINRREFLKYTKGAALRTGAISGMNVVSLAVSLGKSAIFNMNRPEGISNQGQERQNIDVATFANDIAEASSRLHDDTDQTTLANIGMAIGAWFSGDAMGGYLLRNASARTNRLLGAEGLIWGKLIDLYSTYVFAIHMEDPRFKEYGLDYCYKEANFIMPQNPTRADVIKYGIGFVAASAISGWAIPSIGRGYVTASPFIAKNNFLIAAEIKTSMDIGDQIKKGLESGLSADDINKYLNQLGVKKQEEKIKDS